MRAIAVRQLRAAPEPMRLPVPEPNPEEMLLRVEAAGVNPLDWKIIDGLYEGHRPHRFPLVVGVDGAGVVERAPAGDGPFRPGDRVFGQWLHAPVGTGTYAEFATAPAVGSLARVPSGLSMEEAAALPTAGMTALDTLERLGVAHGERLLLIGAAGGVGSIAVQLAHAAGARVVAVSRAAHRAALEALGVERVIDSDRSDPHDQLRSEGTSGLDALFDVVSGPEEFARWAGHLRRGGRAASSVGSASVSALEARGIRAFNVDLQPRSELLDRLAEAALAGRLRVPVRHRRPLEEGPAALAESRAGRSVGKTVLLPGLAPGSAEEAGRSGGR